MRIDIKNCRQCYHHFDVGYEIYCGHRERLTGMPMRASYHSIPKDCPLRKKRIKSEATNGAKPRA